MLFFESESEIDANRIFVLHNLNATAPNDANLIDETDLRNDTALVGYFLGSEDARGEGIESFGSTEIQVTSVEELFGVASEYITLEPEQPDLIPVDQPLPSVSYTIFSNPNLTTRMTAIASQLSNFEVGDYVFTAGDNPHGFLITGWDAAVDCATGNVVVPDLDIPYVADLPNHQVGTSRPFYCSRLADTERNGAWFEHRRWYFIKMPDRMAIKFTRLYSPDPIL